jgi:hypothetical protein
VEYKVKSERWKVKNKHLTWYLNLQLDEVKPETWNLAIAKPETWNKFLMIWLTKYFNITSDL